MPIKLPEVEVKRRLQQLRNVTMLHSKAIGKIAKLEALLRLKDKLLGEKDARIAELETKLLDKELQRKALAGKLWKAKKQRNEDKAEQAGARTPSLASARATS